MDEIRVACAVIWGEEKVLLARRGPGMDQESLWEFPGGKVEEGEEDEACIRREIEEELGWGILVLGRLPDFPFLLGPKRIVLVPFLSRVEGGSLHLAEHSEVKWVDQEGLSLMMGDIAPADKPIVRKILADWGDYSAES